MNTLIRLLVRDDKHLSGNISEADGTMSCQRPQNAPETEIGSPKDHEDF